MSAHVLEELSPYLDDELVPAHRASVDAHLRECAACRERLTELAAVDQSARALPAEAPDGYFDDFTARVRLRLEARVHRPRRWALPVWGYAAAAALALAVTVPALLHRQALEPAPPSELSQAARAPAAPPAQAAARPLASDAPALAEGKAPSSAAVPQEPGPGLKKRDAPRRQDEAELRGLAGGVVGGVADALSDKKADSEALTRQERDASEAPRALAQEEPPARAKQLQSAESAAFAAPPAAGSSGRTSANEAAPTTLPEAVASPRRLELSKDKIGALAERSRFRELLDRPMATLADARALRDAWRVHATLATGDEADEARVRVVEVGAQAYRLARDPRDLAQLERDADAYLARPDALQAGRVRAVLLAVRAERTPPD
jgi:Putative zinc-finger